MGEENPKVIIISAGKQIEFLDVSRAVQTGAAPKTALKP